MCPVHLGMLLVHPISSTYLPQVKGFPIKLSLFSHDNVTFPFQFVTCSYDIVTFSFQYAIQSFQFVSIYSSIVFNHTEYLGIRPRRAFWRYVMNPIRYFMYIHIQFFNNNVQETWYLSFLRESGDTQVMRFCIRNPIQQRRWVYIKTNKKQYYCIIFIFLTLSCVHYSIYWMYILTLILRHWQLIYRLLDLGIRIFQLNGDAYEGICVLIWWYILKVSKNL
jgi:hypothetical protein